MTPAGSQAVAEVDWDDLEAARVSTGFVVARVPGDIGQGPLEQLRTILEDEGLGAVVAFERDALDAVAAALMGPRVTLLCEPDEGEWAAALAIAAHGAVTPGGVREGSDDAERLRRMHEEVARIAALLAALAEQAPADTVDDRRRSYRGEPPAEAAVDPAAVRATIRARRLRAQFFDARLIEDPAWDMLLDLFAAELEGGQVSVSSLCIAAAVAPTTALRWITRLVDAGLFARVPDPRDRRRAFMALSPSASAAMRGYFAALPRGGLLAGS